MTALEVKFSEAISSHPKACLSFSFLMMANNSGSNSSTPKSSNGWEDEVEFDALGSATALLFFPLPLFLLLLLLLLVVLLFADKEEESVVFLTTFLVVAFEFLPVLDKEKEEEESADFDDKENIFVFAVVETLFTGRNAGYPRRRRRTTTMMMLASRLTCAPVMRSKKCGSTRPLSSLD